MNEELRLALKKCDAKSMRFRNDTNGKLEEITKCKVVILMNLNLRKNQGSRWKIVISKEALFSKDRNSMAGISYLRNDNNENR